MQKYLISIIIILGLSVLACKETGNLPVSTDSQTNSSIVKNTITNKKSIESKNQLQNIAQNELTYPDRTDIGNGICEKPPRDCYPDIIVTPKKIYWDELDAHIANNTVASFFAAGGNWVQICDTSVFKGPMLDDLRNGITTLRKNLTSDPNVVNYHVIYTADTLSSPDYSNYPL